MSTQAKKTLYSSYTKEEIVDEFMSLEAMLKMKQDDWIAACAEIDELKATIKLQRELLGECQLFLYPLAEQVKRQSGKLGYSCALSESSYGDVMTFIKKIQSHLGEM